MARDDHGYWELRAADVGAGDRYWYRLDGDRTLPDPASRFQPEGVHGPSEVIDPKAFAWTDLGWMGTSLQHLIIYELHVGTFSPAGTFAGAAARLDEVARLGVTAIEVMPVAEFPGARNWGYDGVDLFAPSRAYGTPGRPARARGCRARAGARGDSRRRLQPPWAGGRVPHRLLSAITSPNVIGAPWGAGVNLDGEHSEHVRAFFIENALHWLTEYHVDGFRLDATHALCDDGPHHFLAEWASRVREVHPRAIVIAEDERKLRRIVSPPAAGGWGFDAVWADDFHHQVRRLLAGDRESYFAEVQRHRARHRTHRGLRVVRPPDR